MFLNNKKANVIEISAWVLIFSFVSMLYISIAIIDFAVMNDFVIYEFQELSQELEADGIVAAGFSNKTQEFGDSFTNFNLHYDDIWLAIYAVFLMSTFLAAYTSKPQNYFGFLTFIFYGIMFVLFLLTLFATLTNWFKTEILLNILPDIIILLPKFYYYLDHIGIFSAVHICICMLINLLDFDISKIINRRKQEQQTLSEEEIV